MDREITVYSFTMGDVDDPVLYAAEPLYKWEQSEKGQWVMKNAIEQPIWMKGVDPSTFGHRFHIRAKFTEQKLVEYYLKFGRSDSVDKT